MFGEVVWSDYFNSQLVVVRYESDDEWWFVVEESPWSIHKARTPLSELM